MARTVVERPAPALVHEVPDGTAATARRWLNVYAGLLRMIDRALAERRPGDRTREPMLRKRREFRRRMLFWEGELRRALVARSDD